MRMSIADNQTLNQSLAPAARTATATGSSVDTGRDGYAREAVIDAGLWTDGTHTFTFEESPDDSAWTALVAAQLDDPAGLLSGASIVIDGAADDNVLIRIGLLSTERYLRVVQTVSGGPATGLVSGAYIVTDKLRHAGGAGQPMSASGKARSVPST